MMKTVKRRSPQRGRRISIEVVEEAGERFVVYQYADGERLREKIHPVKLQESRRKRRFRTKLSLDHTRKKRF